MRRKEWLILSVVLSLASSASALHIWTGNDIDSNYDRNANWDKGWWPGTADETRINRANGKDPLIEPGCNALAGSAKMTLGNVAGNHQLTMDNPDSPFNVGVWTGTNREMIMADHADATATFVMNQGEYNISHTLRCANKGVGILNMNGGTLNIKYGLSVPHNSGLDAGYENVSGTANLNGGWVNARDLQMRSGLHSGHIYITDGMLKIESVQAWNYQTGALDAMVDNSTPGAVAAYILRLADPLDPINGGDARIVAADPGEYISAIYTTTGGMRGYGYTTVWAEPEPAAMLLFGLGSVLFLGRRRGR